MSDTYGFDFAERVPEEALKKIKELTLENEGLRKDVKRLSDMCVERDRTIARFEKNRELREKMVEKEDKDFGVLSKLSNRKPGVFMAEISVKPYFEDVLKAAKRAGATMLSVSFFGEEEAE